MVTIRPDRLVRRLTHRAARRHRRQVLLSTLVPVEQLDRAALRPFFLPQRPGPQTALQALGEPRDLCWVDRWPEPRAVVVVSPGDSVLAGDPDVLKAASLRAIAFKGKVEAPLPFRRLLELAYPNVRPWPRIVCTLDGGLDPRLATGFELRRLGSDDLPLFATIHPHASWTWQHYRTREELTASRLAWIAIAGDRCVSIALPHTRAGMYEDLCAFTDPAFRGLGLAPACVAKVVEDVKSRGHVACWSTSVHHEASLRVARKTGLKKDRVDYVYATKPLV